MTPTRTFLPVLAVLLGAGVAAAQTPAAQTPAVQTQGGRALAPGVTVDVNPAPGSGSATAPAKIDETALRHYARIGDVERLEAEIARLRALDPAWEPPRGLFTPQAQPPGVDESPFWKLLSEGKIPQARAAIAEQRRQTPSWQPSAPLLRELDLAEDTARLRQASEARLWQEVTDIARARPDAVSCARLDNAWRVAEAHGEQTQTEQALAIYRTLVSECSKASERRDTLYKASRYLTPEQMRSLTALATTANPAAGEDYSVVGQVLGELETGRLLERAGTGKGGALSADDLARLETTVRERQDADGALTLGWYFQQRRQHRPAQEWFARSNQWSPSDRAAEGLILAHAGLGERDKALEAAKPWRGRSARVDKAVLTVERPAGRGGGSARPQGPSPLDQALARRDYSACLTAIQRMAAKGGMTAALAQQRGWCLIELSRPSEAEAAFAEAQSLRAAGGKGAGTAAAAREGVPGTQSVEEAAYGRALARLAAGDTVSLAHDLPTLPLSPRHRAEIRASLLAAEANRALEDKRYHDTLRLLDARKEIEPEPRNLGILRGWALYNLHRLDEAYDQFKSIDDRLSTPESREGVTITRTTIYRNWQ